MGSLAKVLFFRKSMPEPRMSMRLKSSLGNRIWENVLFYGNPGRANVASCKFYTFRSYVDLATSKNARALSRNRNQRYCFPLHDQHMKLVGALENEIRKNGLETVLASGEMRLGQNHRDNLPESFQSDNQYKAVHSLHSQGKISEAVEEFNNIMKTGAKPEVETYNAIITIYDQLGQSSKVRELVEEMSAQDVLPTGETYKAAMLAYANADEWEEVLKAIKEMQRNGVRPDLKTYNSVLSVFAESGEYHAAIEVLESMGRQGVDPDVTSMNAVIVACEKGNQYEAAMNLFEVMLVNDDNIAPNEITYCSMLRNAVKHKMHRQALDLYEQMRRKGIKPDAGLYDFVLLACGKCGKYEKVFTVLNDMETAGAGSKPTLHTYHSAINAISLGKRYKLAVKMLEVMKQGGMTPDETTYESIVRVCAYKGRFQPILKLMKQMKVEYGLSPSSALYGMAMKACASKSGNPALVLQLLNEMEMRGLSPSEEVYNQALLGCAKSGNFKLAFRLLKKMKAKGLVPDRLSYTRVISAFAATGNHDMVLQLLNEMQSQGIAPRRETYNLAIAACARDGEYNQAFGILERMTANGVTPDQITFNSILFACEKGKCDELASNLFDSFPSLGIKKNRKAYGSLISAHARAGNVVGVFQRLNEMETIGIPPDEVTYSAAISSCEDYMLLETMKNKGMNPHRRLYHRIIFICSKFSQKINVDALIQQMSANGIPANVDTYNAALLGCEESGDYKFAFDILETMTKQKICPNERTYDAVLSACQTNGNQQLALEVLEAIKANNFRC